MIVSTTLSTLLEYSSCHAFKFVLWFCFSEGVYWFDEKNTTQGFGSMFRLLVFQSSYKGFLVNGEVDIVAEVDVVEVIGKLHVPEESESIDSNGFEVLASQVREILLYT